MVTVMEDLIQGIPVVNTINILHTHEAVVVVIKLKENNLSGIIQDSSSSSSPRLNNKRTHSKL